MKKFLKSAISVWLVLCLIPSMVMTPTFAANPGEGFIPIPDWYAVDSEGQETDNPPSLEDGQVWVNKNVIDKGAGMFTIELYAEGKTYAVEGETKKPLDDDNPDVTVIDEIGVMFELINVVSCDAGAFSESDGVVTWTVSQDDILDGIVACVFNVSLKAGWVSEIPYYTNEGASALFKPQKGNPYYWETERVEIDAFEISDINWNNGVGINSLTITDLIVDKVFTIKGVEPISIVAYDGVRRDFIYDEYYSNQTGEWVDPITADDFTWGLYWNKGGDTDKVYYIWVKGYEGPGVVTRFDIHVDNNGGNTGGVGRRTTYWVNEYHRRDGFDWQDDDFIKTDLPNTGVIELTCKTGSIEVTVDAKEKHDKVTYKNVYERDVWDIFERDVWDIYERDTWDIYERDVWDIYERDVWDIFERDVWDIYERDIWEIFERDVWDIYERNVWDVYERDVWGIYERDVWDIFVRDIWKIFERDVWDIFERDVWDIYERDVWDIFKRDVWGVFERDVWDIYERDVWDVLQRDVWDILQREIQPYIRPVFEKKITKAGQGTLVTWRDSNTVPGGVFGNGMTWVEVNVNDAKQPGGISFGIADSGQGNNPNQYVGYDYNVRIEGNELVLSFDDRFITAGVAAKLYSTPPTVHDPSGHKTMNTGDELRIPLPTPTAAGGSAGASLSTSQSGDNVTIIIKDGASTVASTVVTFEKNKTVTYYLDGYTVQVEYNGNKVKSEKIVSQPPAGPGTEPEPAQVVYLFFHLEKGVTFYTTGNYEFVRWEIDHNEIAKDYYKVGDGASGYYKVGEGASAYVKRDVGGATEYVETGESGVGDYVQTGSDASEYVKTGNDATEYVKVDEGAGEYEKVGEGAGSYEMTGVGAGEYVLQGDGGATEYVKTGNDATAYKKVGEGASEYEKVGDGYGAYAKTGVGEGDYVQTGKGSTEFVKTNKGATKYVKTGSDATDYAKTGSGSSAYEKTGSDATKYVKTGEEEISRETVYATIDDAEFELIVKNDEDETVFSGTITSDADGILIPDLPPGEYTVGIKEDDVWNWKTVTVVAEETVSAAFSVIFEAEDERIEDGDKYVDNPIKDVYIDNPATDVYKSNPVADEYIDNSVADVYIDNPVTDVYKDNPVADVHKDNTVANVYNDHVVADVHNDKPVADVYIDNPIEAEYNDNLVEPVYNDNPIADVKNDKPVDAEYTDISVADVYIDNPVEDLYIDNPIDDVEYIDNVVDDQYIDNRIANVVLPDNEVDAQKLPDIILDSQKVCDDCDETEPYHEHANRLN